MTLWFALSLANATTVIDGTIFSIVGLIYFTMLVTTVTVFKWKYIKSQFRNSGVGKKVMKFFNSDWGRGAALLAGSPFLVFFLLIDFIKQMGRKTCGKKYFSIIYRETVFTRGVTKALVSATHWDFGSVIPKAHLLCLIAFFLLIGVSKFVILFFSSVRTALIDQEFSVAILVMLLIGYIFHMAPLGRSPVVPTYILSGMVIPSVAERRGTMSYGAGLCFTVLICMFVKMTSRVAQYYVGKRYGQKRMRLKRVCQINSPQMKGAHIVLTQRGNLKKKMILLGGAPDFAMGTFTGIKGHNLYTTLALSFPSIVRVVPCILLGAIFVKSGEEPDNNLFAFLTVIAIIGVCGALFVPVIMQILIKNQAAEEFKAIIENQGTDAALAEVEAKNKRIHEKFVEITSWKHMSKPFKILHILSLLVLSFTQYLFNMLESTLFVTFDVTDDINVALDGNPLKIVKEPGWVVLGSFLGAVFYMVLYKKVNKRVAKNLLEREEAAAEELSPNNPNDPSV